MRSTWTCRCCDVWLWNIFLGNDPSRIDIRTSNQNDWSFLWQNSVYFSSTDITSENFFKDPVKNAVIFEASMGAVYSVSNAFSKVLNSLKSTVEKKSMLIKHSQKHIFSLLIPHQCKWKCLSQLSWLMYSIIFRMVCDFWHCGTCVLLWAGRRERNLTTFTEF